MSAASAFTCTQADRTPGYGRFSGRPIDFFYDSLSPLSRIRGPQVFVAPRKKKSRGGALGRGTTTRQCFLFLFLVYCSSGPFFHLAKAQGERHSNKMRRVVPKKYLSPCALSAWARMKSVGRLIFSGCMQSFFFLPTANNRQGAFGGVSFILSMLALLSWPSLRVGQAQ